MSHKKMRIKRQNKRVNKKKKMTMTMTIMRIKKMRKCETGKAEKLENQKNLKITR